MWPAAAPFLSKPSRCSGDLLRDPGVPWASSAPLWAPRLSFAVGVWAGEGGVVAEDSWRLLPRRLPLETAAFAAALSSSFSFALALSSSFSFGAASSASLAAAFASALAVVFCFKSILSI